MNTIEVVEGDITQLVVDVIVNAANSSLGGGGGVDGAIHRAAGTELLQACKLLNGCPTGHVKITPAFNLHAKAVFHAVGPIWRGGQHGEAELLASCYRNSMALMLEHQFESIAFPAISCGIYAYPLQQAVVIAVREVQSALQHNPTIKSVVFCCFDQATATAYQQALVSE